MSINIEKGQGEMKKTKVRKYVTREQDAVNKLNWARTVVRQVRSIAEEFGIPQAELDAMASLIARGAS